MREICHFSAFRFDPPNCAKFRAQARPPLISNKNSRNSGLRQRPCLSTAAALASCLACAAPLGSIAPPRFDAYILEMKTVSAFLRRVAVRPSLHRFRPELKPLKGIDVSSTMDLLLRPRRAAVDAANIRSGTPCRVRRVASRQPVAKQSQKRTMRMTADVP